MTPNHIICRRAVPSDYPDILNLQQANLIANLTPTDTADGFLSMEYTAEQFDEINGNLGVVVAETDKGVVGYLCGISCDYGRQFQILRIMATMFGQLFIDGKELTPRTTFIYGPVCIAKEFRGGEILSCLFEALREIAQPNYSHCILFIADVNKRSLRAHRDKLGMVELETFTVNNKLYHLLGAHIQ